MNNTNVTKNTIADAFVALGNSFALAYALTTNIPTINTPANHRSCPST